MFWIGLLLGFAVGAIIGAAVMWCILSPLAKVGAGFMNGVSK
jgi:hypothetical protein